MRCIFPLGRKIKKDSLFLFFKYVIVDHDYDVIILFNINSKNAASNKPQSPQIMRYVDVFVF